MTTQLEHITATSGAVSETESFLVIQILYRNFKTVDAPELLQMMEHFGSFSNPKPKRRKLAIGIQKLGTNCRRYMACRRSRKAIFLQNETSFVAKHFSLKNETELNEHKG